MAQIMSVVHCYLGSVLVYYQPYAFNSISIVHWGVNAVERHAENAGHKLAVSSTKGPAWS